VAARLPVGLRYAGVAGLGRTIYVAGGLTTAGPSSAVYAVDPLRGTARRVATLPRPLDHVALAPLGRRLLLVGGGSRVVLSIDPHTGMTKAVASLPRALEDPAAVTEGGRVLVLGGGTNAVFALTSTSK
jgi:hypothetical protein